MLTIELLVVVDLRPAGLAGVVVIVIVFGVAIVIVIVIVLTVELLVVVDLRPAGLPGVVIPPEDPEDGQPARLVAVLLLFTARHAPHQPPHPLHPAPDLLETPDNSWKLLAPPPHPLNLPPGLTRAGPWPNISPPQGGGKKDYKNISNILSKTNFRGSRPDRVPSYLVRKIFGRTYSICVAIWACLCTVNIPSFNQKKL